MPTLQLFLLLPLVSSKKADHDATLCFYTLRKSVANKDYYKSIASEENCMAGIHYSILFDPNINLP
jgi:hypothetical protein